MRDEPSLPTFAKKLSNAEDMMSDYYLGAEISVQFQIFRKIKNTLKIKK